MARSLKTIGCRWTLTCKFYPEVISAKEAYVHIFPRDYGLTAPSEIAVEIKEMCKPPLTDITKGTLVGKGHIRLSRPVMIKMLSASTYFPLTDISYQQTVTSYENYINLNGQTI